MSDFRLSGRLPDGGEAPNLPGVRRNPMVQRPKTTKLRTLGKDPMVMSDADKEALKAHNPREPLAFEQHHGKPHSRPFMREGKGMRATYREGGSAKGSSIAHRTGLQLMQDPLRPTLHVARGYGVRKTNDDEHYKTSYGIDYGPRDVRMHRPEATNSGATRRWNEGKEDEGKGEGVEDGAGYSVFGAHHRARGPYYSLHQQKKDQKDLRELKGVEYTEKLMSTTMPFGNKETMPPHLRHDLFGHHGQVLGFDAYFKEAVTESAREDARVRRCRILLYRDDDTISIVEPEGRNTGIPQGLFLRRSKVPRPGAAGRSGQTTDLTDLNVGKDVFIFGRRYHIYNCDDKARAALAEIGIEAGEAEQPPTDAFEETMPVEQKMWGKERNNGKKLTDMKIYMEASKGKEVAVTAKRSQFNAFNRQVLRFDAVWDDRASLYGDVMHYTIHYFLEDDSIEVCERHSKNDGRDQFPKLLKRQKLPARYEEEAQKAHGTRFEDLEQPPAGHFVTHEDLRIGRTVPVYGRDLLLVGCDGFTRRWLESIGEEVPPAIPVEGDHEELPRDEVHPYKGGLVVFGSEEDSLASCKSLVPAVPRRDVGKMLRNARKVLRYSARLDTSVPQDLPRRFIISVYLADDTISVFEPAQRNSGIIGGMFVKRQKLRHADGRPVRAEDIVVGETVTLLRFRFVVLEADEFTKGALAGKEVGVGAPLRVLLQRLQERALRSKHERKEMFFRIDEDRNGFVTVEELRNYLSDSSPQPLNNEEAVALIRCMDNDGDGRVDYDEWCRWLNSDPASWDLGKDQTGLPADFYLRRTDTQDEMTQAQRVVKRFARTFSRKRAQLESVFHKFDPREEMDMDEHQLRNAINLAVSLNSSFLEQAEIELFIRYVLPGDVKTINYRALFDMLWAIDERNVNI